MVRLVHPTDVDWRYVGPNEVEPEVLDQHVAWFAPVLKATSSGMVDGRRARLQGPTNSGSVSENPSPDNSEAGETG